MKAHELVVRNIWREFEYPSFSDFFKQHFREMQGMKTHEFMIYGKNITIDFEYLSTLLFF